MEFDRARAHSPVLGPRYGNRLGHLRRGALHAGRPAPGGAGAPGRRLSGAPRGGIAARGVLRRAGRGPGRRHRDLPARPGAPAEVPRVPLGPEDREPRLAQVGGGAGAGAPAPRHPAGAIPHRAARADLPGHRGGEAPAWKFIAVNGAVAMIEVGIMVGIGYEFGASHELVKDVRWLEIAIGITLALILVVLPAFMKRHLERRQPA